MSNGLLSVYYLIRLPLQSAHNLLISVCMCVLVAGQESLGFGLCVLKYLVKTIKISTWEVNRVCFSVGRKTNTRVIGTT